MAQKTLLNESEIRRFMKLASIEPLAENGFNKFAEDSTIDEDESVDEDLTEMALDAEDDLEDEGPPMDDAAADVAADDPVDDIPPVGGMDDRDGDGVGVGEDTEDQFMDLVRQLADLVGVDVDMDEGGDVDGEMDAEVEDDLGGEGGDVEIDAAMSPEGDEEEMELDMMQQEGEDADDDEDVPGSRYYQEGMDDEIVAEVANRVAARLLADKKQNDIAEKLAERIFNRLSSK